MKYMKSFTASSLCGRKCQYPVICRSYVSGFSGFRASSRSQKIAAYYSHSIVPGGLFVRS